MTTTAPPKSEFEESFAERVDILYRELALSVRFNRPSILLAIYQSTLVADDAANALASKLRAIGQQVIFYQVTGEDDADIPLHLSQRDDIATTVYFVAGLQRGGGADGRNAYRALNIRREYFVQQRIRAVFWLTEKEAIALPAYAPDFWAFRHRVVEFVEPPTPAQVATSARAVAWADFEDRTLREDTDAKIALREALLHDLPAGDETLAARAELCYTLAGLYWAKGEFDRSIQYWQRAIADAERIGDKRLLSASYNGLGNVYRDLGRHDEAIAAYQRAIELDPKLATPHNGLGNVYADLGRHDEAIAAFQRAIELDPKLATPHNGLGTVYADLGRHDEAIAAFQRAIELDPKLAAPHHGLGTVYADLGRHDEAIAVFQRAIELDPKFAYPHHGLGNVYRNLGRHDEAIAAYQRAIELDPKDAVARASLVGALKKVGREAEAAEQIPIVRELIQSESEYNRACFESICGNVNEALTLLKVALEKKQEPLDWVRRDPDFDLIRDDLRFKALVGESDGSSTDTKRTNE